MDFLKKLLFPKTDLNTGLKAKTELDIDNFLSENSVQNLTTSESLISISSIFNPKDKLNLGHNIQDLTVDSPKKHEYFRVAENENQSTIEKVSTPVEMSQTTARVSNELLASNDNINLETVLKKIPIDTTVKWSRRVPKMDQLLTNLRQEVKTPQFIDSAIEITAAVKSTPEYQTSSVENNKVEPTVAVIEQILTDPNEAVIKPPLLSEAPKFINLGSGEINLCPIHTPKDQTACETPKVFQKSFRGPNVNEDTFANDLIGAKEEELNKEVQLDSTIGYENATVIDLTQSEDEMEENDHAGYKDPCPPENQLLSAPVVLSTDEPNQCTAKVLEISAHIEKDNSTLYATIPPVCVNTLTNLESINTQFNAQRIIHTIAQELNIADVESTIINAAKESSENVVAKEDVNEIVSIGSTDDESAATNLYETREPNTTSCGDINYCTNDNYSQCGTNSPGRSGNKNEYTANCDDLDTEQTYDSDFCSGYHSSDFEFISESEAEKDGLIINYRGDKSKLKSGRKRASTARTTVMARKQPRDNRRFDVNLPGHSNSLRQHSEVRDRGNHVIPQGNQYLQMFEGQQRMNIMRYMENKSVLRSVNIMHVDYDALEHNMRQMQQQEVGNQFRDEADETIRKIQGMYPRENRKLQRF